MAYVTCEKAFNQGNMQALFNLGNLHRQSSHHSAAVQCYDAVLALNSQHWRSLLNKAVALTGVHEDRAAQLALKQAYEISGTVHEHDHGPDAGCQVTHQAM